MGVLRGGERADRHQRRRHHRKHLARRRLPQGRPFLFHYQFIHVSFFLFFVTILPLSLCQVFNFSNAYATSSDFGEE